MLTDCVESPGGPHEVVGGNTRRENVCQAPELETQTQPIPTHLSVVGLWPTSASVVAYYSYSLAVVMLNESLFQHCASAQRSGVRKSDLECGGGICTWGTPSWRGRGCEALSSRSAGRMIDVVCDDEHV